jgi:Ca2+-binding RTX toxin-like protein
LADNGLGPDSDPEGGALEVTPLLVKSATGSFSLNADGSFEFLPSIGFVGTEQYTYELVDEAGGTSTGQLTFQVTPRAGDKVGSEQRDLLISGHKNDVALGFGGDDYLSTGSGKDILNGGTGNDILFGGRGSDLLFGGDGNDSFVFKTLKDGSDTIADFDASEDVLAFSSRFGGSPQTRGALVEDVTLIVGEDPTSAVTRGTFLFESDTSKLFWDADGIGRKSPILIATITGVASLDVDDFRFF